MLSSITPLGERSRRQHFMVTATFLLAGSALAGAATGLVLGEIGEHLPLGRESRLLILAAAGAVGFLGDLLLPRGVPTHLRQVDERWLHRYRGWVYGTGYGVQLGVGWATVVTSSAVYLMLFGAALAPTAAPGALIGTVFGAARGASVFLAARVDSPDRLRAFHRRLLLLDRPALATGLALQAALASLAVALSA
jgi:hypothetical protein